MPAVRRKRAAGLSEAGAQRMRRSADGPSRMSRATGHALANSLCERACAPRGGLPPRWEDEQRGYAYDEQKVERQEEKQRGPSVTKA
ncbi:hypothetical protein GCM10008164_45090 [Achromobacter xylosoxidans]|nr:hypothetical protein GCM10008164_45090 [Achromobacter xylosoxidans]